MADEVDEDSDEFDDVLTERRGTIHEVSKMSA